MRTLVPDIETRWFDIYAKVVKTGKAIRIVDEAKALNRWFDVFAFRLGPESSHKVAILFDDISDETLAVQKLKESEERLRAATAAVSDVLWTNDSDGKMQGEQPGWGAFTGQMREDYQGYGWANTVHPEDRESTIASWEASVADKHNFVWEHRVRRHDGQWRLCSVRALPVFNADGSVREWMGVHEDITQRRAGEEKVRQIAAELSDAHRRKDEFLATLAHELRNPLTPIRNGLQVMKMAGVTAAAVEQARAMMERQLAQMVRLVDDLMDVSRISQGKLALRCERVDLAQVLQTAVESSAALIEAKAQKFSLYLAATALTIQADTPPAGTSVFKLAQQCCQIHPSGWPYSVKSRAPGQRRSGDRHRHGRWHCS